MNADKRRFDLFELFIFLKPTEGHRGAQRIMENIMPVREYLNGDGTMANEGGCWELPCHICMFINCRKIYEAVERRKKIYKRNIMNNMISELSRLQ